LILSSGLYEKMFFKLNYVSIHITTNSASKAIQIYKSTRKTIEQIAIYDTFGNLVKRYETPTNKATKTLIFPTTKTSLYFVKLQSENGTVTKKVLL